MTKPADSDQIAKARRISEIAEREKKAEPGPWKLYVYDRSTEGVEGPYPADVTAPIEGRLDINWIGENEARFIAHARADIPFLLSALASERQAVIEECCRKLCVYCNNANSWNPATNGKHAYKFGPDERFCDARAIRSME